MSGGRKCASQGLLRKLCLKRDVHALNISRALCLLRRGAVVDRLVNGGFETGDITGWTAEGMLPWTLVLDASADQFPARGSRYLSQIGVSKLAYMAQTAPTVAGRYHRLTFWLQARETIVGSNLFVAALQPAPTSAFVSEPAGAANAPKLQLGSTAGVFNFSATQPFMQWTLYEIGFAAAGPTTTVRLGFRGKDGLPGGSTQFLVDDVSLLSGGHSRWASTAAAARGVACGMPGTSC